MPALMLQSLRVACITTTGPWRDSAAMTCSTRSESLVLTLARRPDRPPVLSTTRRTLVQRRTTPPHLASTASRRLNPRRTRYRHLDSFRSRRSAALFRTAQHSRHRRLLRRLSLVSTKVKRRISLIRTQSRTRGRTRGSTPTRTTDPDRGVASTSRRTGKVRRLRPRYTTRPDRSTAARRWIRALTRSV